MGWDVYIERFDKAGNQLTTGHAFFPDKEKADKAYEYHRTYTHNPPFAYVSIYEREED